MWKASIKIISLVFLFIIRIRFPVHKKRPHHMRSLVMAEARSPNECTICFETVKTMKILPCSHKFCMCCLKSLENNVRKTVCCPVCREVHEIPCLEKLASIYFGSLVCNICQESKNSAECYWCPKCIRIMCPVCHIDDHSFKGHKVYKWEKLQAVKDCYNYFARAEELAKSKNHADRPESKNSLGVPTNAKKHSRKHSSLRVPYHQQLEDLYGSMECSDANDLGSVSCDDQLTKVANQVIGLACQALAESSGPGAGRETRYASPNPSAPQLSVEDHIEGGNDCRPHPRASAPQISVDEVGITVQVSPPSPVMNENGCLVFTDQILRGLPAEAYVVPEGMRHFVRWKYTGNGFQITKFLQIVAENPQMSRKVILESSEEFLPIPNLRLSRTRIDSFVVWANHGMSEQSQRNLLDFIMALFRASPTLSRFGMDRSANYNRSTLGIIWAHLPNSLVWISIAKISLSPAETELISSQLAARPGIGLELNLHDDLRFWSPMLKLLEATFAKQFGSQVSVSVCNLASDSMVFHRVMQSIMTCKNGALSVILNSFHLTSCNSTALKDLIQRTPWLIELRLCHMSIRDNVKNQLAELCKKHHVKLNCF